jgi:hypothetical protein
MNYKELLDHFESRFHVHIEVGSYSDESIETARAKAANLKAQLIGLGDNLTEADLPSVKQLAIELERTRQMFGAMIALKYRDRLKSGFVSQEEQDAVSADIKLLRL